MKYKVELTADQIDFIDAIHTINETKLTISDIPLPLYVMAGHTAMRYIPSDNVYYRDNGDWSIDYKFINGVVYADSNGEIPDLDGIELLEITYDEYHKNNFGK